MHDLTTPLGKAKAWLRDRLDDGERCPLCGQHAQVYRWSLYSSAVRMLFKLHEISEERGDVFVHSREVKIPGQGGDATRLRFWGLAEHETESREDGGRSGFWRITPRGREFLMDRLKLPKYAYVYDGRVLRFDGPEVGVRDALGTKFSYDDFVRTVSV